MQDVKNSHLMLIATLGAFILLGLLLFYPIPDKNAQIFLAIATLALGFYFGSSANKQPTPLPTVPDLATTINQAIADVAIAQTKGDTK